MHMTSIHSTYRGSFLHIKHVINDFSYIPCTKIAHNNTICCHEYACQCKPYVQLVAEGLCPPHPVCTMRQVLVLVSPADGIENCCPTYECVCEAIVECEVCPEGQGSPNQSDDWKNGRSVDLCKGEISSPTGNYSEDGCCPTFDCYKPCVDFLGVSHGSEYLNSYTYESGSSSEEPSNVTDYGDYYDYGNYSSEDYSYNYSSQVSTDGAIFNSMSWSLEIHLIVKKSVDPWFSTGSSSTNTSIMFPFSNIHTFIYGTSDHGNPNHARLDHPDGIWNYTLTPGKSDLLHKSTETDPNQDLRLIFTPTRRHSR